MRAWRYRCSAYIYPFWRIGGIFAGSFGAGAGGGAGPPSQRPEGVLSRFSWLLCTDRRTRVGFVGNDSMARAPSETLSINLNAPFLVVVLHEPLNNSLTSEEVFRPCSGALFVNKLRGVGVEGSFCRNLVFMGASRSSAPGLGRSFSRG